MFNKSTLILIIFCLVNFGAHLGVLDPTLMEARNFITAREMIEDGHIWETTMNGAPRIEKPPFPTWLTALSALVFGRYDNWVMRIPALLMGILMIFWAYQLAIQIFRKHENVKEIAFISAWILSSTVLTIEMSRTGSWDIFYISIATGGFLYLYKGLLKNRMKDYFISGILLGLSFLSKGPAVLAILVAFIIFLWIDLRKQSIPKVSIKKISLLFFVMLSIGAPWFLYNLFFHSELVSNVGSKEAIIWTTKHVKPFYFYLIFPLYMGIWAIPTVIGMIPAFGRRSIDKKYLPLMAWLGINILLMSLMPMKKERYLLSIMVPTALLAGGFLCGISKDVMLRKRVPIISFFPVSIALILAPVGLMLFQESFSIASLEFFGAVLVSFLGIILMRYLLKGKFHHTVYTLGLSSSIIILCFLPFLASFRDKNIEFVSPNHLTKNELVQGKPIYSVGNHDMRVIWAIGQQIIDFNFQDQKEVEYPIFFVTHQDQLAVQDLFESRSVQSLDTSGYHKQTNDYNLYSYLIEK